MHCLLALAESLDQEPGHSRQEYEERDSLSDGVTQASCAAEPTGTEGIAIDLDTKHERMPVGLTSGATKDVNEIEGAEDDIREIESRLAIKGLRTEMATYPQLALKKGTDVGGVVESRFRKQKQKKHRS